MGFRPPYPYINYITNNGENKIRCMRVLFIFSIFKPTPSLNHFNTTIDFLVDGKAVEECNNLPQGLDETKRAKVIPLTKKAAKD